MTTEPQAQTSERERVIAPYRADPFHHELCAQYDADTAQIRDLQAKLAAREAEVELGARLRNALYAVIPPNYPSSVNHSAEAGARWDRKYIADADHFLVSKEAAYAADEVLCAIRGSEIERRGIALARAIAAAHAPRSETGEGKK